MSCQQVPTAPAFNPYPRSVQVGEFEVAIDGGIWVAIRAVFTKNSEKTGKPIFAQLQSCTGTPQEPQEKRRSPGSPRRLNNGERNAFALTAPAIVSVNTSNCVNLIQALQHVRFAFGGWQCIAFFQVSQYLMCSLPNQLAVFLLVRVTRNLE